MERSKILRHIIGNVIGITLFGIIIPWSKTANTTLPCCPLTVLLPFGVKERIFAEADFRKGCGEAPSCNLWIGAVFSNAYFQTAILMTVEDKKTGAFLNPPLFIILL
jgi:hypothetical protein